MQKLISKKNGVERWLHHDGETVAIETRQSLDAMFDITRRLRNEFQGYKDKGDNHFHRYAVIPPMVIDKWRNDHGIDVFDPEHADRVKKLLNDPDWRYLRTTEGTI